MLGLFVSWLGWLVAVSAVSVVRVVGAARAVGVAGVSGAAAGVVGDGVAGSFCFLCFGWLAVLDWVGLGWVGLSWVRYWLVGWVDLLGLVGCWFVWLVASFLCWFGWACWLRRLVGCVCCLLVNWLGRLFPTAQQTKKPTTQQPNNQTILARRNARSD